MDPVDDEELWRGPDYPEVQKAYLTKQAETELVERIQRRMGGLWVLGEGLQLHPGEGGAEGLRGCEEGVRPYMWFAEDKLMLDNNLKLVMQVRPRCSRLIRRRSGRWR